MAVLKIGQKINFFTVLEFSHSDNHYRKFYKVRCDCGTEKIIQSGLLVSNNTKSCGCLSRRLKRERQLLPDNGGAINHLILIYKRHAKNRGIDYQLEKDEFIKLIKQNCHYCDASPSNLKRSGNDKDDFYYSGIDRVDSSKGYNKDNCVACCNVCNKSKLAMSKESFLLWIEHVYNHSIKKNEKQRVKK